MAQYKLTYFDFAASRGEECRIALFLNGVDFEDVRIKFEQWPSLKSKTPYSCLPTLEAEGRPTLGQSNAILTLIGREHGHHPKDPWEAARHEAVFASVEDLRAAAGPTGDTKDEAEKKRRREAFAAGYLQTWAGSIERQIAGPFFAGATLHLADVKISTILHAYMSGNIDYIGGDAFEPFPKLVALYEAFSKHPKIVEWRAR